MINAYLVNMPNYIFLSSQRRDVESRVKCWGYCSVLSDKEDSEVSKLKSLVTEFIQKYNPKGLSVKDYHAAFEKGELSWQQK